MRAFQGQATSGDFDSRSWIYGLRRVLVVEILNEAPVGGEKGFLAPTEIKSDAITENYANFHAGIHQTSSAMAKKQSELWQMPDEFISITYRVSIQLLLLSV